MNTTPALIAALSGACLLLAACGSADDASTEATVDTVEMPADEALMPVSEEPVADPDATTPDTETTDAADEATAEDAADAAADVAADAAATADAAAE